MSTIRIDDIQPTEIIGTVECCNCKQIIVINDYDIIDGFIMCQNCCGRFIIE